MSAWPEAAWVIKHIKSLQEIIDQSFDFTSYQQQLVELNTRLNNIYDDIDYKNTTILDTGKTKNGKFIPTSEPTNIGTGTIWLVQSS